MTRAEARNWERERGEQLCAARAAMRVWPAFAGVDQIKMSRTNRREGLLAAMSLPWMRCFKLERQGAEQSLHRFAVELESAADYATGTASTAAASYAARDASYAARDRDPDTAFSYAVRAASYAARATPYAGRAASYVARVATLAAVDADRTIPVLETESLLLQPLWRSLDQEDSEPFDRSRDWQSVRERWELLLRDLDLEKWIERYDQACARGFTIEEVRAWFLDEPVSTQVAELPFASDPSQFAEYLFYSSIDSRTAWETAGVLTEECFVKTFEAMREQSEPPEQQLARIKERHKARPDPLWLSWLVESQWEEILPTVKSAWKEVHTSSELA